MNCGKDVFVPALEKVKSCWRPLAHGGKCSADLTGEWFGKRRVLRIGPMYRKQYQTWIVDFHGMEQTVRAVHLMSGRAGCKTTSRLHHGFSGTANRIRPEWSTVKNHHHNIFHSSSASHKQYKNMPFFDGWNPDKGGELWLGAKWIIENLGEKPGPEYTMDVVDHAIGFVPGNLRWAKHSTQHLNKQHRWLGGVSDEEFTVEALRRGYRRADA